MNFELPKKETLQEKTNRLRSIFENSLEENRLLTVTREFSDGRRETISNLVVIEINEDGPELAFLDEEENYTASATMLWSEIAETTIL